MLATSTTGKNAGFTANRFSINEYASFDLLTSGNTNTGWSIQMISNHRKSQHQEDFKIHSCRIYSIVSDVNQQRTYEKNMQHIYPI
jgi:hypothetical protein